MSCQGIEDLVLLTEVVRQQYVSYLERQLQENICAWAGNSRNHHKPTAWSCIDKSVIKLEDKAIKACMAAKLYQRAMVKMIATVRRNTQECRLATVVLEEMQSQRMDSEVQDHFGSKVRSVPNCTADKFTQTTACQDDSHVNGNYDDEYASYELSQKIDLFQARLNESEKKQIPPRCRSRSKSFSGEQQKAADESEDAVAQELAILFGDEPTDLNDIFGIEPGAITDDPQVCAILEEIEQAPEPATPTPPPAAQPNEVNDLRNSRWPCELYAQRRRLNACLVRLLEADWRCEDELRQKFHLLFGEDSDDEFATHISSPSIDLVDEVLLDSCILRIRPWIVRHLMPPLQEGLIGNRFLFKKLAKMLAHSIVLANPYASEQQIKQAVEHLFCFKPKGIQNAYDLENLPTLAVDRFELNDLN